MDAKRTLVVIMKTDVWVSWLLSREDLYMYDEAELVEAKRQIDLTVHKIQAVIKTLEAKEQSERYKS